MPPKNKRLDSVVETDPNAAIKSKRSESLGELEPNMEVLMKHIDDSLAVLKKENDTSQSAANKRIEDELKKTTEILGTINKRFSD